LVPVAIVGLVGGVAEAGSEIVVDKIAMTRWV
jgi:hypothetical protein